MLCACDVLASYLSFINVLGSRVSGYDDTSSYHSPANAADPPATSAEPSAAPGPPPATAGPHAPTGNRPPPPQGRGLRSPFPAPDQLLCPLKKKQSGVAGPGHRAGP